jgi:signal recognition particle receptor subunit alpha
MEESLVQILSPKRRVDILRDVMVARDKGQPYIITFCGVNGVGKSTNLAKVWVLGDVLVVSMIAIYSSMVLVVLTRHTLSFSAIS